MRPYTLILMAGLLAACGSDPTDPALPAANQPRVVNGPATCNACSVVEFTVAGPGLDKVSDATLSNHATQASIPVSVEIRHFVGDSGLVLQIKLTFTEGAAVGDYDLHLLKFGAAGVSGTLRITTAIKVTAESPGPGPGTPPPPPGETGTVHVSTATTGQVPPGQYLVTVDPCDPVYVCPGRYVVAGGTVEIVLNPGVYTIGLSGVPSACTVTPSTVEVTVVANQTVNASLAVSCPAPPPPGTARVTASATGPDLDENFLLIVGPCDIYYYYCSSYQLTPGVPVNISLVAGTYPMELIGVAENCTVATPNKRDVSIVSGVTTNVGFSVTCVAAAKIRVTVSTSGPDADSYFEVQLGNCSPGPCITRSLIPGEIQDFIQLPGTYTIELKDVASNCLVNSTNPVTVTASGGTTTNVAFSVTCTALPPPPPPGTVRVTAPTSGVNPDVLYGVINYSSCDYWYPCTEVPLPAAGFVNFILPPGTYSFQLTGIAANCAVAVPNPATVTVVSGVVTQLPFPVSCH